MKCSILFTVLFIVGCGGKHREEDLPEPVKEQAKPTEKQEPKFTWVADAVSGIATQPKAEKWELLLTCYKLTAEFSDNEVRAKQLLNKRMRLVSVISNVSAGDNENNVFVQTDNDDYQIVCSMPTTEPADMLKRNWCYVIEGTCTGETKTKNGYRINLVRGKILSSGENVSLGGGIAAGEVKRVYDEWSKKP